MRILLNSRFATILGVLFLFIVALIHPGFAFSTDQLSDPDQANEPAKVLVSIYVLNIGKLDMSTGSYTIDFYIDLVSDRPYSIDNIEFMNGNGMCLAPLWVHENLPRIHLDQKN